MSTEDLPETAPAPTIFTRMLVVDSDAAFRASVCATIARSESPVSLSVVSSVTEARQAMVADAFDVALVELGLPAGGCADIIREIANARAGDGMVLLAVFGDKRDILASFATSSGAHLILRAPLVSQHPSPLRTQSFATSDKPLHADDRLTPRQREVLSLLAKGFTDDEIARLLQLSIHTVSTHVKKLYRSLDVHSRAEAVFEGGRAGLL
jgi:DNA-binding NarL/FixJ family response regulator